MRPAVAEKTEIYCSRAQNRRGGTRPKTQSAIHAAECFRPSRALRHVDSVQKHETGLERGWWFLRKLRFIVLTLASSHPVARHSNSQFSRQPLAAFEPRFDFPDRLNTLDRLQRPKTFRGVNPRLRFPGQVASCHAVHFFGDSRLSQQQQILFEFCFVILDRFNTSKHFLESKIFCRAISDCQIWISVKTDSMGGIFVRKSLHAEE